MEQVVVTSGLAFGCPFCGKAGYINGEGGTVFTAPVGHEVKRIQDRSLVVCHAGQWAEVWELVFQWDK